ncbi:MAG: HEAT repeat domain-containing protein, partial [Gemmataceae bacterium]|nr:HEAT repeat domain-containing protein [Gemmataceae bacterium]
MIGTRWLWAVVVGLAVLGPAGAGMFDRKPKSAAQVERLAKALRSDPDEKRRRAAIAELKEADPRAVPDVIPALVGALQRDPSAQVRADAAEAIGSFKTAFPAAGAALEAAAEGDPAAGVRDAAQQALWEYHLSGYRSTKGADGIAGQTAEP